MGDFEFGHHPLQQYEIRAWVPGLQTSLLRRRRIGAELSRSPPWRVLSW
jgi:hypothetical protein